MSSYKPRTARERKLARQFQQRFIAKTGPSLELLKAMLDQTDFTKLFVRERGMTPGEHRRRHRCIS